MQAKMAIVGDYDSILAFKAAGVDAYGATDAQSAKEALKKIAKNYGIIFITDDIAKAIADYLKRFNESAYPIVIPVPSKSGSSGYGMARLKEMSERALGVDILNREGEKDARKNS